MILATELRIGNLVSNTLGETKVVNTEILVYLLNDKNNELLHRLQKTIRAKPP